MNGIKKAGQLKIWMTEFNQCFPYSPTHKFFMANNDVQWKYNEKVLRIQHENE